MSSLAILMTSFNRREYTMRCLRSIAKQNISVDYEVIVADDASTDGSVAAIRDEFPATMILEGSGSLYWGGGMRLASARARNLSFERILWLNDDVELREGAVDELLAISDASTLPTIVVGAVEDADTGELSYSGLRRTSRHNPLRLGRVSPDGERPLAVDSMNGNVVLIPGSVDDALGGLDRDMPHGLGDWDYGLRARRLGVEILLAPHTIGFCKQDDSLGTYGDTTLPLRERLRLLNSTKGLPPRAWYVYVRRHGGAFWFVRWSAPYAYLFRSQFASKFKSKVELSDA